MTTPIGDPPADDQDARCSVCGQFLFTVEAVSLFDEPICGPCQARSQGVTLPEDPDDGLAF